VDVAHELQEVRLVVNKNGFESVLKQMAAALVAMVEADGMSSQQAPHEQRQGCGASADQDVEVV
jgi:hypothetical protein